MIKLRRTIYIGVGGTGTSVLRQLKASYTENGKRKVPPMIGFLAVDSNRTDLDNLKDFNVNEKFHLTSGASNAALIQANSPEDFRWIPEVNNQYLSCIDHYGANQIRSNGRFLFETSEVFAANPGAFSNVIRSIKDRITAAHDNDGIYVDAQNADIDVYLIFSICGGTGSGAFLPLAYKIKSTLGSCNLIGYGFSHSFFNSVGVRENIKPNAYAALLELDYCMQADRPDYQIINFPSKKTIKQTPFDSFMYVDTNTYTRNNKVHSLTRLLQEVKDTVVNALLLSAGTVGAENRSILSNLNALMTGAAGNIQCTNGGFKRAWVSSIGTAEFNCEKDADSHNLANKIAAKQLDVLKKGPSAFDYAKWAKTLYNDVLHINEGGDREDGDFDELINSILNPTDISTLHSDDVSVLDNGDYNPEELDECKIKLLRDMEVKTSHRKEECMSALRRYIISSLFPATSISHKSDGVDNVKTSLNVFVKKVKEFSTQLNKEIEKLDSEIKGIETSISQAQKSIKNISNYTFKGDAKRAQKKNEIALHVKNIAEISLEIERRQKACEVYAEILATCEKYIGFLTTLSDNINKSLSELEAKNTDNDRSTTGHDAESIFIDLTPYARSLSNDLSTSDYQIDNWEDFYSSVLDSKSLEELSEISSWAENFVSYIENKLPSQTSPIILRALAKRLDQEESLRRKGEFDDARSYINRVVDMARPLMDIDNYGNLKAVRTNLIRFVSLPVTKDEALLDRIKDAFKTCLGDEIDFISHANDNRIIVFQQMGVFSPYYIKGIAEVGTQMESCEYKYRELLTSGYSPFIDVEFIKVIKKHGHALDQQIGSDNDEDMLRWVKAIILGIIERGGENNDYRIESEDGDYDLSDDRFWKNLGTTRKQAFQSFASGSADFKREVDKEIISRLENSQFNEVYNDIRNAVVRDRAPKYTAIRLVDSKSEEFQLPETKQQLKAEMECVRNL